MGINDAKERIYGMSYEQWKQQYQLPATQEPLVAYQAKQPK